MAPAATISATSSAAAVTTIATASAAIASTATTVAAAATTAAVTAATATARGAFAGFVDDQWSSAAIGSVERVHRCFEFGIVVHLDKAKAA